MIQKYTLSNVQARHIESINKDLFNCTAVDETGKTYEKVTLWKTDWSTAEIKDGIVVSAELKESEKNGFKNFTLYPERTSSPLGGGRGGAGIKAAQERKGEMIKEAQERKNESIAFFNASNSALTLIEKVMKDVPFTTDKDYQAAITKWRDWFLSEWQKYESSDSTDKHIPF